MRSFQKERPFLCQGTDVLPLTLADVNVEVETLSEYSKEACRNYLISEDCVPNIHVHMTSSDIDKARHGLQAEAERFHFKPYSYSIEQMEWVYLYTKICDRLIDYNVLLFHGSCLSINGAGYMFSAPSGTGKSTHARMWRETFGNRVVMINDDKPLVRVAEDGSAAVYGSPWCGKHNLNTNTSVPLRAIIALNRGTTNRIEKVPRKKAYSYLLSKGIFYPDGASKRLKVAALLDKMNQKVDYYQCWCDISHEAAQVVYDGIKSMESEES